MCNQNQEIRVSNQAIEAIFCQLEFNQPESSHFQKNRSNSEDRWVPIELIESNLEDICFHSLNHLKIIFLFLLLLIFWSNYRCFD